MQAPKRRRKTVPVVSPHHNQLKIGRNLYEALQRIWETDSAEYIWADAVCINQEDKGECSAQVAIMGHIYAQAAAVIIWLGIPSVPSEHLELFFDSTFSEAFEQYLEEDEVLSLAVRLTPEDAVEVLDHTLPAQAVKSLAWFFHNLRWIRRCWTVQEPVLSTGEVVLCGDLMLHYQQIADIAKLVEQHVAFNIAAASDFTEEETQILLSRAQWFNDLKITALVQTTGGAESEHMSRVMDEYFGAQTAFQRQLAYLEWLLFETGYRQSFDSRDRIYSLLGFVNPEPAAEDQMLQPDYSLSVRDVYIQFTSQCLEHLPSLTILDLAHTFQDDGFSKPINDLPTWVPNFTNNYYHQLLWVENARSGRFAPFQASSSREWITTPQRLIKDQKLRLTGRYCGEIKSRFIYDLRRETSTRSTANLHSLYLLLAVLRLGCEDLRPYTDGTLDNNKANSLVDMIAWASKNAQSGGGHLADSKEELMQQFKAWATVRLAKIFEKNEPNSFAPEAEKAQEELWEAYSLLEENGRSFFLPLEQTSSHRIQKFLSWATLGVINASWLARTSWLPTREEIEAAKRLWSDFLTSKSSSASAKLQRLIDGQRKILARVNQTVALRGLFSTSNGLIGQCHIAAKPGDQVWLLQNAHVPFVLSPSENDGEYALIGECYVEGGMHGQLIDQDIAKDAEEVVIV